jgi:AcrR family transcriptional regulator
VEYHQYLVKVPAVRYLVRVSTFQRARSEEQRAERRRAILETAAAMLTEMPVAKISLNELSRRVGLAKPNVLRYFESREDVLLQLLDAELDMWVAALEQEASPIDAPLRERGDHLAQRLVDSLVDRPVLCDLISAQASVLEHNVSAEVAIRHKRAANRAAGAVVDLALAHVPELGERDAWTLVTILLLTVTAVWPSSQPPEALLAAYAAEPELASHRVQLSDYLLRVTQVAISGLLARRDG